MEAVPLFDAQMREAAYQRNKEFERDLGPRQTRFVVERLLDRLDANGAIERTDAEKGLAPLVDKLLAGHVTHMAMEPTPEAIAPIVREVLRALTDANAIDAGAEPAPGMADSGPAASISSGVYSAGSRQRWSSRSRIRFGNVIGTSRIDTGHRYFDRRTLVLVET